MARRKQPADLAARADEAVGALAYGGFATGDMEELRVLLADVADREALAEALIEAAARSPFWMLDPVEMSQFAAFLVLTVGEKAAAGGFERLLGRLGEAAPIAALALLEAALGLSAGMEPPGDAEAHRQMAGQMIARMPKGERGAVALLETLFMTTHAMRGPLALAVAEELTGDRALSFWALAVLSPFEAPIRHRMLELLAERGGAAGRAFLEALTPENAGSEASALARRCLMRLGPEPARKGRKPQIKGSPLAWPLEAAFASPLDESGSQSFYVVRRRAPSKVALFSFVASEVRGIANAMLEPELGLEEVVALLSELNVPGAMLKEVPADDVLARLDEALAVAERTRVPQPVLFDAGCYMLAGLREAGAVEAAPKARAKRAPAKQATAAIYQLKVTLKGARPTIWRRVLVPGDLRLADLHEVIQAAMGWEDCHLHGFFIRGDEYGPAGSGGWGPGPDRDEASCRLDRVVSEGDHFAYEYDFGDGWEHVIKVEKVLAPEAGRRYPAVIKGKGACPPEDSGGVWGYYATLVALQDPASPEHEEALEWLGEDFDPALFDLLEADAAVASLFSRSARRGG